MARAYLKDFQYWPHVIAFSAIVLSYIAYRYFAYHNTTSNDAYVSAHVISIAPIISGPVTKIYIHTNQAVKAGDKLLEIDKQPYLYTLNKAQADLQSAEVNYNNMKLAITVANDRLTQLQSVLALSKNHLQRYQTLQKKGDVAAIELINIEAKIQEQQSAVSGAEEELKMAQQRFDNSAVKAAKAAYEKARYNYDHTVLLAPKDGYITNFNVRRGQYIKQGEALFALIEDKVWWIVTRYRETSIRLIKPGDKAKITLDMYPGKVFNGHVESIGWGINREQSGNVAPSPLVYMEATEDWIKIAQRFPVRIFIDDVSSDYPLRIGASATTTTYR